MYKEFGVLLVIVIIFFYASQQQTKKEGFLSDDGTVFMIVSVIILIGAIIFGAIYSDYVITFANSIPLISSLYTLTRKIKPFTGGDNTGALMQLEVDSVGGGAGDPYDMALDDMEDNASVVSDDIGGNYY